MVSQIPSSLVCMFFVWFYIRSDWLNISFKNSWFWIALVVCETTYLMHSFTSQLQKNTGMQQLIRNTIWTFMTSTCLESIRPFLSSDVYVDKCGLISHNFGRWIGSNWSGTCNLVVEFQVWKNNQVSTTLDKKNSL